MGFLPLYYIIIIYLNSNIEIHKSSLQYDTLSTLNNLNSNIEIHKL